MPRWKKAIAEPDTIQTLMSGKPVRPTVEMLMASPSAVASLDPGKKESEKKIRLVAFAWNAFLGFASEEDQEVLLPPFHRFVDAVVDILETTDDAKAIPTLLNALNLPNLFRYPSQIDSNYVLHHFFELFKNHQREMLGELALMRMERNPHAMLFLPAHLQYMMANEMFDVYARQRRLIRFATKKTACVLSETFLSKPDHLLGSGQLDLLGYALAWAPIYSGEAWRRRVRLMERISREQPVGVQVAVFSKLIDAVKYIPPVDLVQGPEPVPKNIGGYLREVLEFTSRFDHASRMLCEEGKKEALAFIATRLLGKSGATLLAQGNSQFIN